MCLILQCFLRFLIWTRLLCQNKHHNLITLFIIMRIRKIIHTTQCANVRSNFMRQMQNHILESCLHGRARSMTWRIFCFSILSQCVALIILSHLQCFIEFFLVSWNFIISNLLAVYAKKFWSFHWKVDKNWTYRAYVKCIYFWIRKKNDHFKLDLFVVHPLKAYLMVNSLMNSTKRAKPFIHCMPLFDSAN